MSRELKHQLELLEKESIAAAREYSFAMWRKMHPKQQDVISSDKMIAALMGGNQTGKSTSGILRTRFHAVGEYPNDWTGPRTTRGSDYWFAGDRWGTLRDSIQLKMFGRDLDNPGQVIPGQDPPYFTADVIVPGSKRMAQNGGGAIESIQVRHLPSGDVTTLTFKTYHMGMDGVASATIDGIVVDEECPAEILQELLMRLIVKNGWLLSTFTPLRGRSRYFKFLERLSSDVATVRFISQDEVKHLSPTTLAALREMFKNDPGQMEARRTGQPVMSSGLVFPVDSRSVWIDWFPVPSTWACVGGMDIGVGTPTVIMPLYINPNTGDKFISSVYAQEGLTGRMHHFAAMDAFGDINIVMDLAANQRDKFTAETVVKQYNDLAHGKGHEAQIRAELRKYVLVPNRSFSVGHDMLMEDLLGGTLYVMKDPPGIQNYKFSTNGLRDEFEEAVWNEDGTAPKDRNKFHRLDALRYARVGIGYAKVPGHRRLMLGTQRSTPVMESWTPALGNLRS